MINITVGFLNCEIDMTVTENELNDLRNDPRVLYITDENDNELFYDKCRTFDAIMEN